MASAIASPPAPPFTNTSLTSQPCAPAASAAFLIKACSASVSSGKRLIATTTGMPCAWTLAICASRLGMPARRASRSSASRPGSRGLPATMLKRPLCILSARTVQTSSAALGFRPEARHLMLKNFSEPMAAPNPASVIT